MSTTQVDAPKEAKKEALKVCKQRYFPERSVQVGNKQFFG
jgi:hypothetical protein